MIKQWRETLVGIFVVAGAIIFIALYIWLSRKVFFRNTYDVRVQFEEVDGLRAGDPVFVYGLEKGKVKSLQIEGGRVNVVLAVDRDVLLPEGTMISVRALSYIGSDKYVKITPGNGDRIPDLHYGRTGSFDLDALAGQLDSLVMKFRSIELPDLDAAARRISADLNRSIERLVGMVGPPAVRIDTLASRLDSLAVLLQGEGTIGRMMRSDELYQELRETNLALKALIQDINENPKKYINVRVF
jgi:phospholipid/cholesterol/gamma-HCH transport system substrate-binding protein